MASPTIAYTLNTLAEHLKATLVGDGSHVIHNINTLQDAIENELSFLSNSSYQKYLAVTDAGVVILHPSCQHLYSGNKLVTENPYYSFALATELFANAKGSNKNEYSIHPSVIMGRDNQISLQVSIAPNVVIGNNTVIADGVVIGAGCVIADNVTIGKDTMLYPHVCIYSDTCIGDSSIIHSHVVIGSDGFGFAKKSQRQGWQKVHQLGGVIIGDDVEIGAGTTIDRGALGHTRIGDGVKLDNQIQIAHNVEIGNNTAVAGATAIAGSTTIGQSCTIAGAVGIVGHLTITDNVHITAMTLVTKSISQSGSYSSGTPLNLTSRWRKNAARFNRLDELAKHVSLLRKNHSLE